MRHESECFVQFMQAGLLIFIYLLIFYLYKAIFFSGIAHFNLFAARLTRRRFFFAIFFANNNRSKLALNDVIYNARGLTIKVQLRRAQAWSCAVRLQIVERKKQAGKNPLRS